jgi:hypothetical protein
VIGEIRCKITRWCGRADDMEGCENKSWNKKSDKRNVGEGKLMR